MYVDLMYIYFFLLQQWQHKLVVASQRPTCRTKLCQEKGSTYGPRDLGEPLSPRSKSVFWTQKSSLKADRCSPHGFNSNVTTATSPSSPAPRSLSSSTARPRCSAKSAETRSSSSGAPPSTKRPSRSCPAATSPARSAWTPGASRTTLAPSADWSYATPDAATGSLHGASRMRAFTCCHGLYLTGAKSRPCAANVSGNS